MRASRVILNPHWRDLPPPPRASCASKLVVFALREKCVSSPIASDQHHFHVRNAFSPSKWSNFHQKLSKIEICFFLFLRWSTIPKGFYSATPKRINRLEVLVIPDHQVRFVMRIFRISIYLHQVRSPMCISGFRKPNLESIWRGDKNRTVEKFV